MEDTGNVDVSEIEVTPGGLDTSPDAIQALPSLEELGVPPEFLEAAGELFSDADGPGVEEYRLSTLLRLIFFHLRNIRESQWLCPLRENLAGLSLSSREP